MSAQRLSVRIAGIVTDLNRAQPGRWEPQRISAGEFVIEPSTDATDADFRCNVAVKMAPHWGIPAHQAAEQIAERLRVADGIEAVAVVPTGFLGITMDDAALGQVAVQIVAEGSTGRTPENASKAQHPPWRQPLEQAEREFASRHGDVVDPDLLRYSLARHSPPTPDDLDPALLSRASDDNPAYLVRRAHARASALIRNGADLGIEIPAALAGFDGIQLQHPGERALLRQLSGFADLAERAVRKNQSRILTKYTEQTADRFFDVVAQGSLLPIGDALPGPEHHARLILVAATKIVVHDALELLGVSAPERM